MRIYEGFGEAVSDTKRDLGEMGTRVQSASVQDIMVAGNPELEAQYLMRELMWYGYTVTKPADTIHELNPVQPWADAEIAERLSEQPLNPGEAWKHREEYWQQFIHDGEFAYAYPERMAGQITRIIEEIKVRPTSRQLWIPIWDRQIDGERIGTAGGNRVPCSLGYHFMMRLGKLNMIYVMRSCDFATHFQNDAWLATKLLCHVAEQTGFEVGAFSHFMFSLHVFQKDVADVF